MFILYAKARRSQWEAACAQRASTSPSGAQPIPPTQSSGTPTPPKKWFPQLILPGAALILGGAALMGAGVYVQMLNNQPSGGCATAPDDCQLFNRTKTLCSSICSGRRGTRGRHRVNSLLGLSHETPRSRKQPDNEDINLHINIARLYQFPEQVDCYLVGKRECDRSAQLILALRRAVRQSLSPV